ncbi:MAG: bifunctional diguanylate cyclase/phosphodiesterase [Wenzhouxiangella sp.]|nr:MAG: bifunctional diguanylate cyclase/phosphodiesterase [Wenzhouxiangella sp.]
MPAHSDKTSQLINLQYELAMLVGGTLRLNPMLRQFFPPALKALGCKAAHLWLKDQADGAARLRFSYPSRDKSVWQQDPAYARIASRLAEDTGQTAILQLGPDHHALRLPLGDIGFCVLIGKGKGIEPNTIAALAPIFRRLGNAVRASLQHEKTENLQYRAETSERRLQYLLDELPTVAVKGYLLDGTLNYWNQASENLYGYKREEAIGANLLDLIIPPELRQRVHSALEAVARGGDVKGGETMMMGKDGRHIPVHSSHLVMHRPGLPTELFSVDIDLTERKRHETALAHAANHDMLTGLPNRHLLHSHLRQASGRARRSGQTFAICYIDLDRFKPINDHFGHHVGDQVLIAAGNCLSEMVREGDVVARLGGDEFVLLLESVDQTEALMDRLSSILAGLTRAMPLKGKEHAISASMGVAFYPRDGDDPDTLLRHADLAMYQAKSEGRNCFRLFDARMQQEAEESGKRRRALDSGLANNEFRLVYQPIVRLRDSQLIGLEALVRWQHPERGLLTPVAFLESLEGEQLERRFGEKVFELAVAQIQRWNETWRRCRVSVNLTGHHLLQQDFIDRVSELLDRHPGVEPSQLVFEILESIAMRDLGQVAAALNRCRERHFRIALDDFGTGYSSLSRLRQLPVDILKIDRSFVANMLDDRGDRSIVQSAIELARVFELEVIAEGPETAEHLCLLETMGCDLAQGYAIAAAMPAEAIPEWFDRWESDQIQAPLWSGSTPRDDMSA